MNQAEPGKADEYRARARECRELAEVAKNDEARATFERMAAQWDKLAAEFERHERLTWKPIATRAR
ncbi:MAG: hypothetical protein M5U07_11390 [Xanthobacteraceae bacterium]|nr:hypothetical protein [Xanthobacteraceae bacterium]